MLTVLEPQLVQAGAARSISGLTAPGLCCRSDYPRGERRARLEWLPEALSKYRFASFLCAQHMVQPCLTHSKLRQARVLDTTLLCPFLLLLIVSTALVFLLTQHLNKETGL